MNRARATLNLLIGLGLASGLTAPSAADEAILMRYRPAVDLEIRADNAPMKLEVDDGSDLEGFQRYVNHFRLVANP